DARYQHDLALACLYLGQILLKTGRFKEAVPVYRKSLVFFEKLTTRFPMSLYLRSLGVGGGNNSLGNALLELNRLEEAEKAFRRSLAAREQAHRLAPKRNHLAHGLALTNCCYARLLLRTGRIDAAEKALRCARRLQQRHVDHFPMH